MKKGILKIAEGDFTALSIAKKNKFLTPYAILSLISQMPAYVFAMTSTANDIMWKGKAWDAPHRGRTWQKLESCKYSINEAQRAVLFAAAVACDY